MQQDWESCNFTIKAQDVLKYGPHPGCPACKYIAQEVPTQSGHSEECKIRIMVEMKNDENGHRVRKWYVPKGIDEGEVSFKDHVEGTAGEGGTPEKQEPRVTGSEDVHLSDASGSSSSNMALRGTAKRHDNEDGREEVTRSQNTQRRQQLAARDREEPKRRTQRSRNQEAEDLVPEPM